MSDLNTAIAFAAKAHEGQIRKGLGQPYFFHPLEVLSLASLITDDKEVLSAAILHDTVEDTEATIEQIASLFSERVTKLVGEESEDKIPNLPKSETWKLRKEIAIKKLIESDDIGVKIICLCDKLSNLRSFHLMLLQDGENAWNAFNMKDPKMHYWYYNSLKEAMAELAYSPVYKEYAFLIDVIFSKYLEEKK